MGNQQGGVPFDGSFHITLLFALGLLSSVVFGRGLTAIILTSINYSTSVLHRIDFFYRLCIQDGNGRSRSDRET